MDRLLRDLMNPDLAATDAESVTEPLAGSDVARLYEDWNNGITARREFCDWMQKSGVVWTKHDNGNDLLVHLTAGGGSVRFRFNDNGFLCGIGDE